MKAEIREYLEENGYVMHFWHIEDINGIAEDEGIILSDEEIEDIRQDLGENTDCEYGITWDSIRDKVLNAVENRI